MSDYRRFISYLYEYRQNIRGQNRGFVRAEVRNGVCALEIHMKIPSLPSGIALSVCGFVREGDSLTALPLHQARTGNGIFLTRLVTDPLKIGGFPFSFDQLNGLVIRSEKDLFFGTAWDDHPIHPESFRLFSNPTPPQTPSPEKEPQNTPPEDTKPPISPENSVQEEEPPAPEEVEALSSPACLPSAAADPRWTQVQQNFPSISPFSDDTICDCVQLDLKDLPRLRKEGWLMGSNRFLLHGYYTHRHLLMGKLSGRDGLCYILGVPGFYDRQEQFAAGSFGFPCFQPAARQETSGKTFGYWFRPVS